MYTEVSRPTFAEIGIQKESTAEVGIQADEDEMALAMSPPQSRIVMAPSALAVVTETNREA